MADENTPQEEQKQNEENTPEGMTPVEARATLENGDKAKAKFYFDFKPNVDEAVEAFGGDLVHKKFIQAAKIDAQSVMRSLLQDGKTPDEVAEYMSEHWVPGSSRDTSEAALLNRYLKMSEEERIAFMEKLTSIAS